MADLPNANAILFDIHGEYSTDSFKKEGIVHFIGLALLMLLMVVISFNDIQKLIS